jgi:hypothetical protein
MLDPWIIEEIRRREEEQRRKERLPAVIEMPVHGPRPDEREEQGRPPAVPTPGSEETPRGVTVIDFSVAD